MCERAATDYTNERACSHVMHARSHIHPHTHIHILVDTFLHARVGGAGNERTAGRKQKLPLALVFLLPSISLSLNGWCKKVRENSTIKCRTLRSMRRAKKKAKENDAKLPLALGEYDKVHTHTQIYINCNCSP